MTNPSIGESMANWRSVRGRRVFFPAHLEDRTMMTCGLKRNVLLLLCVASVLLSGCVSQRKYNELQGQYNALQESSATQAAQHAADMAAMQQELATDRAHIGRLQDAIKYTVNSDLLFRSGSWQMSSKGQALIAKLAPKLAPFQRTQILVSSYTDNAPVGAALKRQRITSNEVLSQKRAEVVMQYLISQGVTPDLISARGFEIGRAHV